MYLLALFFAAGVVLLHVTGTLPPAAAVFLLFSLLLLRWPAGRILAGLACGYCWAAMHAWLALNQLPDARLEGRTVLVTGMVTAQPLQRSGHSTRLLLRTERILDGGQWTEYRALLRLGWYRDAEPPQPGERWQLAVRLKRPHGFANPGGFDYERWLFQQGIRATGYIRDDIRNQRLAPAQLPLIQGWRLRLADQFDAGGNAPQLALLRALTIGDRSAMTQAQWSVLNATGTTHLMAISGLHISFVAGLVFWLVRAAWSRCATAASYLAAHRVAAVAAMVAAGIYSVLAGFGIPVRRALIMVILCMLVLPAGRRASVPQAIMLAAALTLLIDPQSVLATGWWLSFLAVSLLAWLTAGRIGRPRYRGGRWLWLQVALVTGMSPVLALLFQQVSIIAPLANSVAIPLVGLLVVPLALAGALFGTLSATAGDLLLGLSATVLEWLWPVLEWLADLQPAGFRPVSVPSWAIWPALAGILWLIAPRGVPGRGLALLLVMPLLWVHPREPAYAELFATVLDVGQGLAVVLQTEQHVMVYDTGARFSPSFDAGSAVLLPFLASRGIGSIDNLTVSHGDNDHIGGVAALLDTYRPARVLSSVPELVAGPGAESCQDGQYWEWDGVRFEVLHPSSAAALDGNNASCVLRIEAGNGMSLLLTGDIEQQAEAVLLKTRMRSLPADVLLAPHHGSLTSSSMPFIEAVHPRVVIFPAGYLNRYRLPNAAVVERYREKGATVYRTGYDGAVSVMFAAGRNEPIVSCQRTRMRRFWHWRE